MSPLSLILNVLWIVFGGFWMALGWWLAAVVMVITIIGIPWARAAWIIGVYTLLPFGRSVITRPDDDIGTGPLGVIGNIIWFLLAGLWLAIGHVVTAAMLAVTIIGLPFAWVHLKLIPISLWPIGKTIVDDQ